MKLNKSFLLFSSLLVSLFILSSCGIIPSPVTPKAAISGQVLIPPNAGGLSKDITGWVPAANATVTIVDANGVTHTVTTDDNGFYSFENIVVHPNTVITATATVNGNTVVLKSVIPQAVGADENYDAGTMTPESTALALVIEEIIKIGIEEKDILLDEILNTNNFTALLVLVSEILEDYMNLSDDSDIADAVSNVINELFPPPTPPFGPSSSPTSPPAQDDEGEVIHFESSTDLNGIATFVLKDGREIQVQVIDVHTKLPLPNINSYLITDGITIAYLFADPDGNYLPRITADEQNSGILARSSQARYTGVIKELWNMLKTSPSGYQPVYADTIDSELMKYIFKEFFIFCYFSKLGDLWTTLQQFILEFGADMAIGHGVAAGIPGVGPYISFTLTVIESGNMIAYNSWVMIYTEKGYSSEQIFEIYRLDPKKVTPSASLVPFVFPAEEPSGLPNGNEFTLTMAAVPTEGGSATDITNNGPYTEGTGVEISAVATGGYEFLNWTSDPAGDFFDDVNSATTNITMPAHNITVTANFIILTQNIIFSENFYRTDWQYTSGDSAFDEWTTEFYNEEGLIPEYYRGKEAPSDCPLWDITDSNIAGGTSPEARYVNLNPDYLYSYFYDGYSKLISPVIATSGSNELYLVFKHAINGCLAAHLYTLKVQVSLVGSSEWNDVWTKQPGWDDFPSQTAWVNLNSFAGQNIQIAWGLYGNSNGVNYWWIDDIIVFGN